MTENLQLLLKDALLNNSYDYDVMHNTIKNTWMNSYSYLYSLQKAYIEYEELFYFSNDTDSRNSSAIGKLYLDKRNRANFDVDYDLIHVMDREEFRLSKYYLKPFTIDDIVYNTKIFKKIPIIIIDDQVIWDYTMTAKKDTITFTLPFKRKFVLKDERNSETDDIIYQDHKIQVLIIDNIFYQRYRMNKSSLYFNAVNKSIKINKKKMEELSLQDINTVVRKEYMDSKGYIYPSQLSPTDESKINKEVKKKLKAIKLPNQDGTMMCSIHLINSQDRGYELGTALIPVEDMGEYYIGYLTDDLIENISAHTFDLYISFVFFNRLYRHTLYTGDKIITATDEGADLMVIQSEEMVPYKTPIPVENFMIFKQKSDNSGYILEKNTEMLDLHYPNIYRLKDSSMESGDMYKVYYYYHNAYDLEYTVLFDFYYKFLTDVFQNQKIEKIINDIYYNREDLSGYSDEQKESFREVFDSIINYQYFNHQYGESDFLNRYLPLEVNARKTPIEYKDETLKKWIRVQPWVLRDYVLEQKKLGESYHLYTNTLDLPSRLRNNTSTEIGKLSKEFDEPRYVFAFNNERDYPILLDCRVFVDGILISDVYQERKLFMDYFYIPASMVTEDSYIELEIFPSYTYEKEVSFSSFDDSIRVTIDKPEEKIFPTIADLYFEDANDKTKRYKASLFSIFCHYNRGDIPFEGGDIDDSDLIMMEIKEIANDSDFVDKDGNLVCNVERVPDEPGEYSILSNPLYYSMEDNVIDSFSRRIRFTRLNSFTIQPLSGTVIDKPLKLKFTKCPQTVRFIINRSGYHYIEISNDNFNYHVDYLRIFKNGKLMARGKYKFVSRSGKGNVIFLEWLEKGDDIFIDITPYRYTQIYFQEELKEGQTLIDLRKIINKPFDIRYYDVYLNGRKLSTNNVFAISPWEITLVNIKSNYNLIIFEKERDFEYFGLDYNFDIYHYTISDLLSSDFITEELRNKTIRDIIDKLKDERLNIHPNTNDEEILDFTDEEEIYALFDIFYHYELIPKTYVNPDRLQFNNEIISLIYNDIYSAYLRSPYNDSKTFIEKNRRSGYTNVLMLDPDIYIESTLSNINLSLQLLEKEVDTDYITETGDMICDVERIPDNPANYNENDNPLIYTLDPQVITDESTIVDRNVMVYDVGHPEDVEQSILDETITIPNEGNIEKKGDVV